MDGLLLSSPFEWPAVWDFGGHSEEVSIAASTDTPKSRAISITAIVLAGLFTLSVCFRYQRPLKQLPLSLSFLTCVLVLLQVVLAGANGVLIWLSTSSIGAKPDFDHLAKPCAGLLGCMIYVLSAARYRFVTPRTIYCLLSVIIWIASEPISCPTRSWVHAVPSVIIASHLGAFLIEVMYGIQSLQDGVDFKRGDLSVVHQCFFSWLDPIIDIAKTQNVAESDLCDLDENLLAANLQHEYDELLANSPSASLSLVKYLYAFRSKEAVYTVGLQLGYVVSRTITPLLLQKLLQAPSVHRLLVLFCVRLAGSFCKNHSSFYATVIATSFKATYTMEIYKVTLGLSKRSSGSQEAPINLLEVDSQRVVDWILKLHDIWAAPLTTVLSLGALFNLIGPINTASSVIALVLVYPLVQILGASMQRTIVNLMQRKDVRTETVTETISKIKTIKLCGWESIFEQKIDAARQEELDSMKSMAILQGLISGLMSLCPQLMASFAFFSIWISDGCLSVGCVFPILGLFTILDNSLSLIPASLMAYLNANTSYQRLHAFIASGNTPTNTPRSHYTKLISHGSPSVQLRSVSLSSGDDESKKTYLERMCIDLTGPQLVTLAGPSGSGKTALLDLIAGDLMPEDGTVLLSGTMVCQTQNPWVMSGSIRDNITFGTKYDPCWYQQVIFACALQPDLDILPQGDSTIVSSSGMNLSGGQKSRIALARAVYTKADIMLLDDPLASVDIEVRQHLIEHVFGPRGLLVNALQIVTTSSIELISVADWNLVIDDEKRLQMTKPSKCLTDENRDDAPGKTSALLISKTSSDRRANQGIRPSNFEAGIVQNAIELTAPADSGAVPVSVYRQWLSLCHPLGAIVVLLCIVSGRLVQLFSTYSLKRLSEETHDKKLPFLYAFIASNILQAFCTMAFIAAAWFLCLLPTARRLHQRLVLGCLRSSLQFFVDTTTGQIVNRFTNDIVKADGPIASYFIVITITGSITVMITSLLVFAIPQSLAGILLIGWVFYRIQKQYRHVARDIRRIELHTRDPLITCLQDTWSGALPIRLFRMEDMFTRQMSHKVNRNSQSFFIRICLEQWADLRLEILAHLTFLLSGWYMILNHTDVAMIGLVMNYVLSLTNVINQLVNIRAALEFDMVSIQRILEYCHLAPERQIAAHPLSKISPPPSWPEEGRVIFDGVWAKYRPDLPFCLENTSFTVLPGQKLALVGRTGAGKSSVALALGRFIEAMQGSIVIDGHDIAQIELETLRRQVGIIPQQATLFKGTLRFNLDPEGLHDDAELLQVLQDCYLSEVFGDHPDVLGLSLDQNEVSYSAGQLQLLSVARGLLRRTKILVMDETTASLDPKMNSLLQTLFHQRLCNQTIITVTHRLETILDYDCVAVFDKGRVVEFDSPASLFNKSDSVFARMVNESDLTQAARTLYQGPLVENL